MNKIDLESSLLENKADIINLADVDLKRKVNN